MAQQPQVTQFHPPPTRKIFHAEVFKSAADFQDLLALENPQGKAFIHNKALASDVEFQILNQITKLINKDDAY